MLDYARPVSRSIFDPLCGSCGETHDPCAPVCLGSGEPVRPAADPWDWMGYASPFEARVYRLVRTRRYRSVLALGSGRC